MGVIILHVEGGRQQWKVLQFVPHMAARPTRNFEVENVKSRAESTEGCVELMKVTEISA